MRRVKLSDVMNDRALRSSIVSDVRKGSVFVYPTDTIYGIGCNAENGDSVSRIRKAKSRDSGKPFSVIAPSKEWIQRNTKVSNVNMKLISDMLPGPYTIILPSSPSSPKTVVSSERTLGVRIPRHPFSEIVAEAGVPFVTTSVNLSGEPSVKSVDDVPETMLEYIDWIIDSGKLDGSPSRIFDMRTDDIKVIQRK
jgi:tRNA threonylcarbamoyl adenosine modification protein (Sua5/YciO/YrdC/YwlC family)